MTVGILVINAGSTSVKFAGYRHDGGDELSRAARGQIEGIGSHPHFIVKGADGKPLDAHEWEVDDPLTQDGALRFIFGWLKAHLKELTFAAAGHRLVLGGVRHDRPVLVDEAILAELDSLCKVEPSHQPYEIAGIRAVAKVEPKIPQVACFDTSFHRTMPEIAQLYALPRSVIEGNVRHWGYHGISYDYISRQFRNMPRTPGGSSPPILAAAAASAPCSTANPSTPLWVSARLKARRCRRVVARLTPGSFCIS